MKNISTISLLLSSRMKSTNYSISTGLQKKVIGLFRYRRTEDIFSFTEKSAGQTKFCQALMNDHRFDDVKDSAFNGVDYGNVRLLLVCCKRSFYVVSTAAYDRTVSRQAIIKKAASCG